MTARKNPAIGSSFEDFLAEEGLLEEANAIAAKRVIAWQLAEAMKAQSITKKVLAERMNTSRPVVDRLLDASLGVTLKTVAKAAEVLGLRAVITLESTANARTSPARAAARRRTGSRSQPAGR